MTREIEADLDAQILDTFGETVLISNEPVYCVFESSIEIEDEGGVIATVDALVVPDCQTVTLGQTVYVRGRDYTINRFLSKEGTLNRYQIV